MKETNINIDTKVKLQNKIINVLNTIIINIIKNYIVFNKEQRDSIYNKIK